MIMERNKEWFKITSVHRDDLIAAGFDGDAVDDYKMERMVHYMANDYLEQLFWTQISIYAEVLGIPKLGDRK